MGGTGRNGGERGRRRHGAQPTVADVAGMAGVSPMTVSRVINRASGVLPATRAKVVEAIRVLGYVPNVAARTLAGARQCRIAMLHSNPSAAYLSEFMVGCLGGATENDAQLILEHWDGHEHAEALALRLEADRIDAVVLPPPLSEDARLLAALEGRALAIARVATGLTSLPGHTVSIEDVSAAAAITRHLIDLGHRRIGFIGGDPNQSASALRREGHDRALREAGITPDEDLIVAGDFTYRSGLRAAEALLGCARRPTAIFASNDDMAAAAVAVAHRRGLETPADLSVCGFDDTAMAMTIWPELTTIRQPIADMARAAVGLLSQVVLDTAKAALAGPQQRKFPFELVARASSGPPPAD